MVASLIAVPLFPQIDADKSSAVFNGQEILIVDNGYEFEIKAYGSNSQEILKNSGIILHREDIIFSEISGEHQKIIISRAIPVTINLLGKTREIYTHKKTIREVLEEADIKIKSSQLINYSLSEEVFPKMEIKISKKIEPRPQSQLTPQLEPRLEPKPKSEPAPEIKQKPAKLETMGGTQVGSASWYSYIPGNYCASLKFPRGAKLLVTNLSNGRSVVVTVNDAGPFNGRVIDLERNAFAQIASLSAGTARVRVERIK